MSKPFTDSLCAPLVMVSSRIPKTLQCGLKNPQPLGFLGNWGMLLFGPSETPSSFSPSRDEGHIEVLDHAVSGALVEGQRRAHSNDRARSLRSTIVPTPNWLTTRSRAFKRKAGLWTSRCRSFVQATLK